jgi:hypothetical protein
VLIKVSKHLLAALQTVIAKKYDRYCFFAKAVILLHSGFNCGLSMLTIID